LRKVLFAAALTCIFLVAMPLIAVPVQGGGNNNPNKLWGAQTYLLNILGKKSDWKGDPSYESTDRRTMFVPENVKEFGFTDCKIWVKQGPEFAVLDPNMFDDGHCNLTIGPGYYEVYFVALGKPGPEAKLEGWIYNATENAYLLFIGDVTVRHNKRPDWRRGTGILYVSGDEAGGILAAVGWTWEQLLAWCAAQGLFVHPEFGVWVFDFIRWLEEVYPGTEYLYLWKLVSGCKHIQVRFYKIG